MSTITNRNSISEALHDFLEIRETKGKGVGTYALKDIPKGSLVVIGRPLAIAPVRTDMSFQIDWNKHVELNDPAERINHSCDPNLGIRVNEFGGYNFIARRDIKKGEEITWCYPTSEYVSIAVKDCLCGTRACTGKVTGWEDVPDHMKEKFMKEGFVAPFIMEKISFIVTRNRTDLPHPAFLQETLADTELPEQDH
ncbi:SET domain-containing protein [Candidatus Roizmanbacteria bacterium]|nr:SET domain-containing protein [Candidatus Roizmanbacteria bacterium]